MGWRCVPCSVLGDGHERRIIDRIRHHGPTDAREASLPIAESHTVADVNADTVAYADGNAAPVPDTDRHADSDATSVPDPDRHADSDATSDADPVGNTHALTDADRHDARADARLFRGRAGARVVERDVALAHLGSRRRAAVVER